jgi:cephalosporin hydroxylase
MFHVDTDKEMIIYEENSEKKSCGFGTSEAFSLVSKLWLRVGWDLKYQYSFTWLGRPIIQTPEDMFRIQELIFSVKPDVIIETGIAHGGTLVFYASLCKAIGHGKVIGIDIEIRPHNKKALKEHSLTPYFTLIEGSSIDPAIVEHVKSLIKPGNKVIVFLDSCHQKAHVLAELEAYGPLISVGSYIVAMDGIMEEIVGAPRTQEDWSWNNPKRAAMEFVEKNKNFVITEPGFVFNEGSVKERVTYYPSGIIKRIR